MVSERFSALAADPDAGIPGFGTAQFLSVVVVH